MKGAHYYFIKGDEIVMNVTVCGVLCITNYVINLF